MQVLWILRWPIKALLFLSVALFVVYSVLITTNAVLSNPLFNKLTALCYFPFIHDALNKGKGEGLGFLKEDVLYSAAVWVIWGLTFAAALLTLALRNIPRRSRVITADDDASTPLLKSHKELPAPCSMGKRILHYHLPPRNFWNWACGGMAVYDALVVLAWAVVNVLYVQQRVSLILPIFKKFIEQGLFPDMSTTKALIALISGALGWAATLDILLLFYPVPRSVFLHWMMGTNFASLIKYHRWLGHGTMAILTVHGCGFYAMWLWDHEWLRGLVWDRNGTNMLAGTLSWLSGCALWGTSMEYVRRNYFELFYKTHILGFLGFMLFGFMHHISLWAYTMPGLLLYLLDVAFRCAQQVQPVHVGKVAACKSATLATLHFDADPFTPIKPVQDLFLGVDGLSPVQWHPYSTVGGEAPSTLVAHIKAYGSWTRGLMARLLRDGGVTMRVDGPYGEEEERPEWTHFSTLVIFAGGIGVTPVFGILNDIVTRRADKALAAAAPPPLRVLFVYVASQKNELALLQRRLVADARAEGWLDLDAYYTGALRGGDPSDFDALEGKAKAAADAPVLAPIDSAADLTLPRGTSRVFKAATGEAVCGRWMRQTLPPYFFGDAHWALAHVLCLAGAIAGGAAAFAYSAHANTLREDGAPDWLIGLYLILFSSAGGMLLPLLIIIPSHILRARRVRQLQAAAPSRSEEGGSSSGDDSAHAEAELESGGYVGLAEAEVTPRRPDIPAVLRTLCAEHAAEQQIGVVAAGPEGMVDAVAAACHAHNDTVGLRGRPYLHITKHTYSL